MSRIPSHTGVMRAALILLAALSAFAATNDDLHNAVRAGDLERVRVLLKQGVPSNAVDSPGATAQHGADFKARNPDTGMTPLHEAAVKGQAEVVKALLAAGADLSVRDASGATALEEALHYRQKGVIEALLAKGARKPGEEEFAPKALHEAILHGQADMVRLLLDTGADPNRPSLDAATPLDDACLKVQKEIPGRLIAHRAQGNAWNNAGAT